MAAIWYIGRANVRSISTSEWAAAGIPGMAATVWNQANGWSLPKAGFTQAQIDLLDLDDGFNVNGSDGPRPGDSVIAGLDDAATRSWVQEYLTGQFSEPESGINAALSATFDNQMTVVRADGSADHSEVLHAALNTPGPKTVQLIGAFKVSGNAVACTTSDTVIDATRATFTLITAGNILRLGTITPQRTVTGSMAAGAAVVTASAGTFSATDIGRSVVVPGAGPQSTSGAVDLQPYRTNLTGVVASVAGDGTSATLTGITADTAVTAVAVQVFNRVKNVKLLRGEYRRGAIQGPANNDAHSILVRRVDGLEIDSPKSYSTAGKYSIFVGDVTDFNIHAPGGNVASDGVHGVGPLKGGRITGVSYEYTGDDTVALGNSDYITYADISGPIENVKIEVDNTTTHGRAVLLFNACSNVHRMTGVSIDRVRGTSTNTHLVVLNGDTVDGNPGGLQHISLGDIEGHTPTGATALVSVTGTVGDVVFERLRQRNTGSYVVATRGDASSKVKSIRGRSITVPDGYNTRVFNIDNTTVVGALSLASFKGSLSTAATLVNLSGDVDQINLADIITSGGAGSGALVMVNASAVGPVDVYLDRVDTDNYVVRHSAVGQVINIRCGSVNARSTAVNPFRTFAAATLNVSGGPVAAANATMVSYTSTGSGRVNGPTLGVDVSKVVGKVAGDTALNLNAGLACGTGPVITDGTSWKHLFTGATYTPA